MMFIEMHRFIVRILFGVVLLTAGFLQAQPTAAPQSEADTIYRQATRFLDDGKYPEAEAAFRKTAALEPERARGMAGVADVYLKQKKEGEAIRLMRDLSEKYAGRADFRVALGNTLVHANRFDDAVVQFRRVLAGLDQSSNAAADLDLRISEALYKKGDLNAAVAELVQARKIVPNNRPIVNALGMMLDGAGQKQQARLVYEESLTLDPGNPIILNNLAYLLAENTGDFDLALTYVERARSARPGSREITDTLAYIYTKQNRNDEAIALYRDLVRTATLPSFTALSQSGPPLSEVHMNLATVLDQKGERKAAVAELKAALESHPSAATEKNIHAMLQRWGEQP
jgi:tetratricopeptide (TPR) repeat protein